MYSGERKKEEEEMDKKIVGEFKNDGEYCLSYEDLFVGNEKDFSTPCEDSFEG